MFLYNQNCKMKNKIVRREMKEQLLRKYYAENAKELRSLVDKILCKFGGITQKDYDDFYSLANEVFVKVLEGYDNTQSFEGFLYSCLSNKLKTEITRRNRQKRQADRNTISLDMPVGEDQETTLGELLVSNFNMERELEERNTCFIEEKIEMYMNSLSHIQRQILKLKMNGLHKAEILKQLKITEKIYNDNFAQIKSYDKTSLLFDKVFLISMKNKEEEKVVTQQTSEISKNTNYSILSYIKKMEKYAIRGDHPLQRNSNQWNNLQRHNLITTVLNDFPIPEVILAEQVKSYGIENWLIDGKQRLTNLSDYRNDVFRVGNNAERGLIKYQVALRDEVGSIVLDKNGFPKYENKEFDIKGKYYSELPEELQEKFDDYTISAVQYLNCSNEDIEYHIRRYNAAKPMSAAQKGITHLGEEYASVVKKIAQHTFFKDKGAFKPSEFVNGTIDRVVTESIMTIHFLNDWKKRQEDICTYLKLNVKVRHFNNFENILDRLSDVIYLEVSDMLNSKDAFLWFGLFDRFSELGFEDKKFMEFMMELRNNLHCVKVKGESYDDLCTKGTKDKYTVVKKLTILETLMNDFLHIERKNCIEEFKVTDKLLKLYIQEFKNADIIKLINIKSEGESIQTAVQTLMMVCGEDDVSDKAVLSFLSGGYGTSEDIEDTLLYLAGLNDWSLGVNNNSSIFRKENIPVLVKLVGHIYKNEIDEYGAIRWFEKFVENFEVDGGFSRENKEKYKKMVESLNRYLTYFYKVTL